MLCINEKSMIPSPGAGGVNVGGNDIMAFFLSPALPAGTGVFV